MSRCISEERPYTVELEEDERNAVLRYAELYRCSVDDVIRMMFADLMERIDEVDRCMSSINDYEMTGRSLPLEEIAKKYGITQNEH